MPGRVLSPLIVITLLLSPAGALAAQEPAGLPPDLRDDLEERLRAHRGVAGLALIDLTSGDTLAIRGDEAFPSASIIKIPVMAEVFWRVEEGRLSLFDPLTVLDGDRTGGSGILQFLSTPRQITVWDAVFLMITLSDNTATNLLLDKVRPQSINDRLASLGLEHSRIFTGVNREARESFAPDSVNRYGFGVATPVEIAGFLVRLHRRELVSEDASAQMLEVLTRQLYREGMPRYLPQGVTVAHKTGSLDRARNDCGLVYGPDRPFALCVMTKDNEDRSWTVENEAERMIADITALVFREMNPSMTEPAGSP